MKGTHEVVQVGLSTESQESGDFACDTSSVREIARAAVDVAALDHSPDLRGLF